MRIAIIGTVKMNRSRPWLHDGECAQLVAQGKALEHPLSTRRQRESDAATIRMA